MAATAVALWCHWLVHWLVVSRAEFRLKETPEKMVDILRKTWTRKMGPKGRAAALGLQLGPEESALITEALGA